MNVQMGAFSNIFQIFIFSNSQESCSKVSHAARELTTVFSVTSCYFLVKIVCQLVKMPPPTEGVLAHHCLQVQNLPHF